MDCFKNDILHLYKTCTLQLCCLNHMLIYFTTHPPIKSPDPLTHQLTESINPLIQSTHSPNSHINPLTQSTDPLTHSIEPLIQSHPLPINSFTQSIYLLTHGHLLTHTTTHSMHSRQPTNNFIPLNSPYFRKSFTRSNHSHHSHINALTCLFVLINGSLFGLNLI